MVGVSAKHARSAGHLPRLEKVTRSAWLVVLQGGEELGLSGLEEPSFTERPGVDWARPNLGHDLVPVLHVLIADLGSGLHDHSGEDDGDILRSGKPKSFS